MTASPMGFPAGAVHRPAGDTDDHDVFDDGTLDVFLKKAGAQLWIQHDFIANATLKKAPGFYE